jgi:DNA-binding CsgD family transcriptional regulator
MQRPIELLDLILDLQLGNNTMEEWAERLAKLVNCAAACAISWTAENPDSALISYSKERIEFQPDWIASVDQLIATAKPKQPGLLKNIAREFDAMHDDPKDPLNDPDLLIAYLDSEPACTLLALRRHQKDGAWTKADSDHFCEFLPVLHKAHQLHKVVVRAGNRLDIANQILNGTPRGLLAITPTAMIIKANTMALDIFNREDGFANKDGELIITVPKVAQQLDEKLAYIQAASIEELEKFIWHTRFRNTHDESTYQLAMRVYPLGDWHLESNRYDRFITLFITASKLTSKPTTKQLHDLFGLTRKQAQLIIFLLDGNGIKVSADKLQVSVHTVRSHLRSIYKKLGVDNKTEMLRIISTTNVIYSKSN